MKRALLWALSVLAVPATGHLLLGNSSESREQALRRPLLVVAISC